MNKRVTRILKDFRLKGLFAARKLGIQNYQVHKIELSEQKLIYIPIPKNACTSTKQVLHRIEFGRVFDTTRPVNDPYVDIHDYYKKRDGAFTGTEKLNSATDYNRFAIIRDPVGRLISCYRNRVIDLGDLKRDAASLHKSGLSAMPDLNTFVMNLKKYRKANKSIEHHSRPQSAFLGGTLRYLDYVIPIEDLEGLQQFLKRYSPGLTFLKRKSGGTKVEVADLSEDALRSAVRFYDEDYGLLQNYYNTEDLLNMYNLRK